MVEYRDKILGGIMDIKKYIDKEISFEEAMELTQIKGSKLMELFSVANEIREKKCGNQMDACTITNAKSGLCSENCKFCAQSAFYDTGIETYDLKNVEKLKFSIRQQSGPGRFRTFDLRMAELRSEPMDQGETDHATRVVR